MELNSILDLLSVIISIISVLINLIFITLIQAKLPKWKSKDVVFLSLSAGSIVLNFSYLTYAIFKGYSHHAENYVNADICRFSGLMNISGFGIILFSIGFLIFGSLLELVKSKSFNLKFYIIGVSTIAILFLAGSGACAGLGLFEEMPSKLYCSIMLNSESKSINDKLSNILVIVVYSFGLLIYPLSLISIWLFSRSSKANFGINPNNFESQTKLNVKLSESKASASSSNFMNYYKCKTQLLGYFTIYTLILLPSIFIVGVKLREIITNQEVTFTIDVISQALLILLTVLIPIVLTITEVDYKFNIFCYNKN
ncbi:hypothetical protein CONCODRAFT_68898 [Conidiobolus coronatus NRRL 28638]|uniref:Uncharacterized protein n=1 Tax=Conidiobolus coronatus (strain ATCC 28846 / CBS 209.66 / NRRL 28638) TaxID=796925 RepID=A0A137PCA6_CONC2|nr:hypothetical protein CONCODRAFT_68898 [Conidiobolus coronatus NRRL 28638]|eukprot:KXN72613.1 hypothetical protein CONCODRAFT_68898 [Conidiobolus coronatus NRRL 28638]